MDIFACVSYSIRLMHNTPHNGPFTVILLGKNVQSIQTEERPQILLIRLEASEKWDALLISETCRELREEQLATDAGHLFMGSGAKQGQKSVAMLLHKRWKHSVISSNQ